MRRNRSELGFSWKLGGVFLKPGRNIPEFRDTGFSLSREIECGVW